MTISEQRSIVSCRSGAGCDAVTSGLAVVAATHRPGGGAAEAHVLPGNYCGLHAPAGRESRAPWTLPCCWPRHCWPGGQARAVWRPKKVASRLPDTSRWPLELAVLCRRATQPQGCRAAAHGLYAPSKSLQLHPRSPCSTRWLCWRDGTTGAAASVALSLCAASERASAPAAGVRCVPLLLGVSTGATACPPVAASWQLAVPSGTQQPGGQGTASTGTLN